MIGDSLTSDIRGGHDAGLHTVWFDPCRRPPHPEISPDHTVFDLSEIPALLDLIR